MKGNSYILLIILCCICSDIFGQRDSSTLLKIEWDGGVLRRDYAYPMMGVGISLQLPYSKITLSHSRALATLGQPIVWREFYESTNSDEIVSIPQRFRGLNYSELTFGTNFTMGRMEFVGGIGLFVQNTKDNFSYGVFDADTGIGYQKTRGENEFGVSIHMGYQWKKWNFAYQWYGSEYRNLNAGWLKLAYSLDLTRKRYLKKPIAFSLIKKKSESVPFKFVVLLRDKYSIPISGKFSGTTTKFGAGLQCYFKNDTKIYFNLDLIIMRHGADNTEKIWLPGIVYNQNRTRGVMFSAQYQLNASIRSAGLGWNKVKNIGKNLITFEYGGGLNFNHFSGWEFEWYRNSQSTAQISKYFLGAFLQTQYRFGPFENGIELNLPFWKMPPYISFYWAIGINFRKKGRKLAPYDKVPQY